MKKIGKCPYCDNGEIEVRKTEINGKKVNIFACSNAHWEKDIDDWLLTSDSTCSFRIFGNSLRRYNKRALGEYEIKKLLTDGELEVKLHRRNPYYEKDEKGNKKKKHKEYTKFIITNQEYGVEVLWD